MLFKLAVRHRRRHSSKTSPKPNALDSDCVVVPASRIEQDVWIILGQDYSKRIRRQFSLPTLEGNIEYRSLLGPSRIVRGDELSDQRSNVVRPAAVLRVALAKRFDSASLLDSQVARMRAGHPDRWLPGDRSCPGIGRVSFVAEGRALPNEHFL